MQDDQTAKPADEPIESTQSSDNDVPNLTLAGGAPATSEPQIDAQAESSIPDPALEALNKTQNDKPDEATTTEPISGTPPETVTTTEATASPNDNAIGDSDLDPIKKEALQKLEPLVSELDLHPEEKYRALMMIIQATDNKDLVNEAYQTADKIEDKKARAQALLSIVNEIEYFKSKESASNQ